MDNNVVHSPTKLLESNSSMALQVVAQCAPEGCLIFKIEETLEAIISLKSGKAPGPDKLPGDLYRSEPSIWSWFHVRFYRDMLAMVFAIEEINRTPDLLPNITLGFWIFDSCLSQIKAIGGILELLSGSQRPIPGYTCNIRPMPTGVVGEIMSSISVPLARILGLFRFPQISYGSVLSALSDKLQFPSFLRTVPSSSFQNVALARIIGHFGWTWTGMIISDDDVGLQGGLDTKWIIEANGGCVAFMEKVHISYTREKLLHVVRVAQLHGVKVIIVHSPDVHVKGIIETFAAQNVTDKVFVFSATFKLTLGLFNEDSWKIFNGSLGLAPHNTEMENFEAFLTHRHPLRDSNDIFIKQFWEKVFSCKWPGFEETNVMTTMENGSRSIFCSVNQTLEKKDSRFFELYDLSYTYHSYLAVYALAHSLNALMTCKNGQGPFIKGACADINNLQPWQVLHYVKKVNITLQNDDQIYFDVNGDSPRAYDILNVQIVDADDIRLVNVGSFDPQESDYVYVNTKAILWAQTPQVPISVCNPNCLPGHRRAAKEGKPICCFQCVACSVGEITDPRTNDCRKCPDDQWSNLKQDQCIQKVTEFLSFEEPLGVILPTCGAFLFFLTACVLFLFIRYHNTPIVKANNRGLSYLLLVTLMCCFLCSFIFIGHPGKLTCMLRQTVFGIIFSISVSSVLAKTIIVVIAFKATNPTSTARKWLGSKTPSCIVFFCSMIQVIICFVWLVDSPPFPEINLKSFHEKMTFECNEGDTMFFYCMLGYLGLLATVSFIVAFLARNLPGSFNEAKMITFSMLVFVSVWVSFIPAYLSTRGKYMVAVEVFAILSSSAGLLGCIFFPKCYIILIRPERNTRQLLVRKECF
ncbi:extracellular calcium-sensing receptor-like [Pleurodeles waltl]|uniref:extracellular calcium-sensing receptor-like n=1 Tax=Pleurodeles waltl TaxID=8319 RepID=UPI0037096E71